MSLNDVYTSAQTIILRDGVKIDDVKICLFKTYLVRIFARRTLFPFRYFSIHVKMRVSLTYSAIEWVKMNVANSNALNSREKPAVSPMSGSPTFDIDK